jgi:hypothetical protein
MNYVKKKIQNIFIFENYLFRNDLIGPEILSRLEGRGWEQAARKIFRHTLNCYLSYLRDGNSSTGITLKNKKA